MVHCVDAGEYKKLIVDGRTVTSVSRLQCIGKLLRQTNFVR